MIKMEFEGETLTEVAEKMLNVLCMIKGIGISGKGDGNETGENDRGGDAEVR